MANLMDVIKAKLAEGGIQDAVGVEVTFNTGERVSIISDNHPALARELNDEDVLGLEVKPSKSAGAGARPAADEAEGQMTW